MKGLIQLKDCETGDLGEGWKACQEIFADLRRKLLPIVQLHNQLEASRLQR
jgi:hypothetical protein